MKKTNTNLMLCAMVFAVALVISNIITAKTIQTGIPLFGSTILVPSAVICYCVTFLMTDVIGEIWGRKEARTVVLGGFACQVLATCLILVGEVLPAADPSMQAAYDMLLGQNAVFVIASMTAYLLAQSWDVFIFHRIRNAWINRRGSTKGGRWLWNNASTMTSQMIDTVIFIIGAFYGVVPDLFSMILSQYVVKLAYAALDTIPFYLLTNAKRNS
jgi:uncharacterized integral membrane protein (TIGR00697 family)